MQEEKLITIEITESYEVPPVTQVDIKNISEVIITVTAVPTHVPKKVAEQVVIYSSGGTFRLYLYDAVGNTWKYSALT